MPLSLPTWSQTKTTSKAGFDKVYKVVDKLGDPVNRLSNKIGSEAFWPTTLDRESDKAARILRSFCKDGFYVDEQHDRVVGGSVPKGKVRVVKKIPAEVIQRAKGLAIFTTMRTGLWVSGAGGSGILVARTATGEWSPPSGIMLHTAGLGFLVGVDIYDCVVVINTEKALQAFSKIRCTVGGEISAVAGPVGIGGVLETEIHKRQAPLWTYLKSRGFYAGVQVDGTVIIERTDENERFYGERIGVADILAGKVRHAPFETRTLMETIKAAQGDSDVDESALPAPEPTPGDVDLEKADHLNGFGLPAEDDPDPFGVRALEREGLEIKEAGTNQRPSAEAFEYKPSPSSPIYSTFNRYSMDSTYRRNSKRSSQHSTASVDRGTQTDMFGVVPNGEFQRDHSPIKKTTENLALEVDGEHSGLNGATSNEQLQADGAPEVSEGATPPVISRARLVTIPKRTPPALPPRSPYRSLPPTITSSEPQSSPTEIEPQGLGLDLGRSSPHQSDDHHSVVIPLSPTKEDMDHTIDNIHLSPGNETDRLSPRKDGFDELSMSGSDYSRETPAAIYNKEVNDNVDTPQTSFSTANHQPSHARTTHNVPDQTPNHEPLEIVDSTAWNSHEEFPGKADEFHSVPSTPLEALPSENFDVKKEEMKEDS